MVVILRVLIMVGLGCPLDGELLVLAREKGGYHLPELAQFEGTFVSTIAEKYLEKRKESLIY